MAKLIKNSNSDFFLKKNAIYVYIYLSTFIKFYLFQIEDIVIKKEKIPVINYQL